MIEINEEAFKKVSAKIKPALSFNGPITASDFPAGRFDLVFSCGVLIHIAPETLEANMKKMYEYSNKYVLICEYFSRAPQELTYHGEARKLFKRDFGKFFLEHFPVNVVSYGSLWGGEFELAGFDDMTWWLFEKQVVG